MSKSTAREKWNSYIHMTYVRKDFAECQKTIERQLMDEKRLSEYPLYVKGTQHSLACLLVYWTYSFVN